MPNTDKRYVIIDTLTDLYHDSKCKYTFEGAQKFLRSLYELDLDMSPPYLGGDYKVPDNPTDLNKALNNYCYELQEVTI